MGNPVWGSVHQALFNGNGLARRLLVAVIAFSSVVTTVVTAIELYAGYRRDLQAISSAFDFIGRSHVPSLARSVWQFDVDLVNSQLEGLLHLPDVEFAAVVVDGQVRWSAGHVQAQRQLRTELLLMYVQGGEARAIGTLQVVASVDRALARVWDRVLVALLGNGIRTLLVAVFLLFVFQLLVTQHLARVARFLRSISPARLAAPQPVLALDRPAAGRGRPDILDGVVAAINGLLQSLRQAQDELQASHRQLEARVRERTAQLEAARDEAQHANRAKSEFLSRMSHELRTPLNAVLGFAQLLEMANPPPGQRRWIGQIRQAGEHLLELIDELLDMARIDVGKLAVRPVPVEVDPVVREVVALFEAAAPGRRVTLQVVAQAQPAWVLADRTRLRQIVMNLVSNAIKYSPEGSTVHIERRLLDGAQVELAVSDSGPGIPADRLDRLFVPFERLGQEQSAIPGTGIGLALSRRLAELMHGTLGMEPNPGGGSRFWLRLPATALVPAGNVYVPPAPQQLAGPALRVLYVEDNPANLALLQAFFEQFPRFTLLAAQDGPGGLALARSALPDVVLLDIQLPGMDGYAVLAELQRDPATRGIPVVAISADAMPPDIARSKVAGFTAYLAKPLQLQDLAALLQQLAPAVGK
jgi:signal transduction histidine kinase/ActR/RegA family two-component response regulator